MLFVGFDGNFIVFVSDTSHFKGPVKGVIHVLSLIFKAWYVAISEGSRVVVGISTRHQSLVAIS